MSAPLAAPPRPDVGGRKTAQERVTSSGRTLLVVIRATMPPARGFLPLVLLLGVWELVASARPSPHFPPPSGWWEGLRLWYWDGLFVNLRATLQTVFLGLILATVLGTVVGLIISTVAGVRRSLNTILEFLRTLPAPTIIPIALLFFGPGETMKLFAVTFAAVWPVLMNTASAAGAINHTLVDVARVLRLGKLEYIRKVVFPVAVPYVLLGVRVAVPIALIVTILIEMLVSTPGIGRDLMNAQRAFRTASAFGLLFVVGILGYLLNALFVILQGLILRRWPHRGEETAEL